MEETNLTMKKLLILPIMMLVLVLALHPALAIDPAEYTVTSVTDCGNTSSLYDSFYQKGQLDSPIPGLAEGLIPQGIAWMAEEDWLLFAGYRTDHGPSALIAVDRQTGQITRAASLRNVDGSVYDGHAGGVCVTDTDIYLSNAHRLFRLSKDAFLALSAPGECTFEQEIPVPVNASYCCFADGVLWVGEFQYTGDYPTDSTHTIRTADGLQKAWTCGYVLADRENFDHPDYILSVTERIQGITIRDGHIYLSQSYGRRNPSTLFRYSDVLAQDHPDTWVDLEGVSVPLWILDSAVREAALVAPPMTECLCTVPEGVCVLFESAAEKYMDPANASVNPMDRVFLLTDF